MKYLFFLLFVFFLVIPLVQGVEAAILQFDPSISSTSVDETIEIKLIVNSSGEEINSTDIFVLYDPNLLETQSVGNGTFFPTVLSDLSKKGRAYVAGIVDSPGTFKVGAGTVASIIFRTKAAGSATLTFDCTPGSTTDSNIAKNDLNATDILECGANGKSVVTIGSTSTTTQTSTPTSTPTPTTVSNPVGSLPKSGIFEQMALSAGVGVALLLVGTGLRIFL